MQNAIKKAFTGAVVAATIAWSVGLSAIPFAAKAAPASGTLVKASLPAVYYVGANGKRFVFPNEKTYKTWFSDFSGVQTITDAELAALPIGGNVTYKPGVRMVKITTDPKVYAVDANGTLRWVSTEAAATALYGASWNQMIDDVPDAFFTNYSLGADIVTASDFSPAAASAAAISINKDKGLDNVADGSLMAMLSSVQPMGGTIPGNATGVNMVKVDVKNASSSDVTLYSMTVHRSGVGSSADFSYVYAYEGATRLTTGRTINSSTNEAVFGGLNLTIPAGSTKTLWVSADMAAGTAGNQNLIEVKEITTSTGTMVSGLPVSGPVFTMAGATVGQVTIAKNGSFTAAKAGSNAKVAEFQLSASSSEDVMVSKIALYYTGSTQRENLSNFTLMQAGSTIATADVLSAKDLVTFVLATPFKLEKGASRIFQVYADVSGNARAGEYIAFHLDNASDLYATGATYGYGVSVVRTTYDATGFNSATSPITCGNTSCLSVDAGQINLTYNGPASRDVAVDGSDVELFNFTMSAQSNVEVRNVNVSLTAGNVAGTSDGLIDDTGSSNVANYSDIKLVDTATGAVVGGPMDLSVAAHTAGAGIDSTQTVVFNSVFSMSAGQSRTFKVTADVANNSAAAFAGDTITASLLTFAAGDIRNLDNNTNVTDIVPNTGITGNAATIQAATISVSASSTPVAQTYIAGAQGVALGGMIFKAGDVGAMKVSALTLKPVAGAGASAAQYATGVQTASLWNGSTMIGNVESPDSTTGNLVFTNLNLDIPAGQSVTVTLKGNLSSIATATTYRYGIAASTTDVTASDADGASKSVTGGAVPFNTMTISANGTMTVALAANDTESEAGIVVGGASNVVLAKYKFTAQDEELKLTKAQFDVAGAPTAIQSLSLYDGSTLVGGPVGVDGTGVAEFTGLNFVVAKDATKTLTVKANLNSVGASGATTGLDAKVRLLTTGYEVRGTAAGSSTVITTVTGGVNIAANSKIIRKSKPTVSLSSLPSSVLTKGDVTIMRFVVAADAAGDVAMSRVTLSVTEGISDGTVTLGTPKLRRVGSTDVVTTPTWTTPGTTNLIFDLTAEEVIAAGTAKTFDVIITLGGAGAIQSGDSISSKLVETAGAIATGLSTAVTGDFVWSDMSIVPHAIGAGGSADWANGYYVKTLDSDSQTLVK